MDQLPCTYFFGRNMAQRWTGAHILSLNIWLLDFFETLRWFCSSGPKPQSVSQALQELHADTSAERSTCWAVLAIQGESTVFNAVQPKTLQWCLHICFHMFPQYEPRSERAFRTMQAKMVEQWEHFQAQRSALVHPRCCRGCRYSLSTARRDLTSDEMIWNAFNII